MRLRLSFAYIRLNISPDMTIGEQVAIHNSSIVDDSVTFGVEVTIGRFCIIEDNVVLGDNVSVGDYCLIESGARIGSGTTIGTYCKIGSSAEIGTDCSFTAYCEIRSKSTVGDRVSMGSRCTLSAGTVVENDVIIKYGFVATDTPDLHHNDSKVTCVLKAHSLYGANVTIMPGITVGRGSEIGASSQVRHSVPDGEVWYGTPAKFYKRADTR